MPLDQAMREQITRNIEGEHHVHLTGVFPHPNDTPTPHFTYTTGIYGQLGFELIVFAMNHRSAGALLNDIAEKLYAGTEKIVLDEPDLRWCTMPVVFKRCTHPALHTDFVCVSDAYYGTDVETYQIVLPDRAGYFPWHPEFDHAYMDRMQPTLFD